MHPEWACTLASLADSPEKLARKEQELAFSDLVIVEIKSVDTVMSVHESQLLTYLKLSNKEIGLLLNFNVKKLTDGITRKIMMRKT